ncbi:MAG: hypothetical protein V1787_03905 [Candidatus Micrarchaeota archaeon]
MDCGKCGKPFDVALCPDCVQGTVDDGMGALAERLDGFDKRLTEIEGEIVRIQQKMLYTR